jgi:hypothetical protein
MYRTFSLVADSPVCGNSIPAFIDLFQYRII